MPPHIVAVDDQSEVRGLLRDIFKAQKRELVGFENGELALTHIGEQEADVELVVLDVDLGHGKKNGIEICQELRTSFPDLPIIILTGRANVDDAVEAMKAGADDYLVKDPYLEEKLELSVGKIQRMLAHLRERRRLEGENRQLRESNKRLRAIAGERWRIVGESPSLTKCLSLIERVAKVPRPVLVLGERGTGKELVARAIHSLSNRSSEPFITINCAAVAESLLESELFGHEEGAFTGATKQKEGKFELADGGTLFLDEIGNMSLEFQAKILRILEYQRFERVAGADSIQVDVRVIAATNADLHAGMEDGRFRADLYDRLAFQVITLPPLRERLDDLPLLVTHFLTRFRQEVAGIDVDGFSAEAIEAMARYDFPGNVRELKNIVERAIYFTDGKMVQKANIEEALPSTSGNRKGSQGIISWDDDSSLPLQKRVEEYERALCQDALMRARYNQKEAAELLGCTYDQFRQRYRKYGLSKP